MFLALFILATICLNANADLLLGPSDSEAVIGTDITLKCSLATQQSSACSVEWTHKRRSRDMFHVIYTRCYMIGDYATRYSVVGNPNQGEYNLMIRNVSLEDFGTYTCRDNTDGSNLKAQLIVFDSYPSSKFCSIEAPPDGPIGNNICGIEPDEVKLSCNMSFSGNIIPKMEWAQVDGHVMTSNITTTLHSNKTVIVSSLVLNAAQIRNTAYICRIKYIGSNLESSISWSTTIWISHAYNMKNRTEVISVQSSMQKFDCAKAGDPGNCSYSWEHGGEKLTANGSLLTLTDDSNGIYTCSVVCSIRGRSCSSAPMTLNVSSVQKSTLTKKLIITLTVVLLTLLLGVFVVLYLVRKKKCFIYRKVLCEAERINGCQTSINQPFCPSIAKNNKYNYDLHLPMPSSTVGA